jgi:hypothetical protein
MQGINPIDNGNQYYYNNNSSYFKDNNEVESEFLKIFYRSLLKESLKEFNVTENNDIFSSLSKDVMLDKFAEELAEKTGINYLKEGKSDK